MSFVWNSSTLISFPFYFFYFVFTVSILAMIQLHSSSARLITMATRLISMPLATIKIDLFVSNYFLIAFTDSSTSTKSLPSIVLSFTIVSAINQSV